MKQNGIVSRIIAYRSMKLRLIEGSCEFRDKRHASYLLLGKGVGKEADIPELVTPICDIPYSKLGSIHTCIDDNHEARQTPSNLLWSSE